VCALELQVEEERRILFCPFTSRQIGPNAGCPDGPKAQCAASDAYRGGYCASGSHTVTLYEALSTLPGVNLSFAVGADQLDYNSTGLAAAVAAGACALASLARTQMQCAFATT
jgi:hypothetical protein